MSQQMNPLAGTRKHTMVRVEATAWRRLAVSAWRKRMSRTALLNDMLVRVVSLTPDPTPEELAEGCPNPNGDLK